MSLRTDIKDAIKTAMKAKDTHTRDALRLLDAAFKQIEVDERRELSDEDTIKIIQKQVKQRADAMSQYKEAGRDDLYEIEAAEVLIYEKYLPKQLSDDELVSAVKEVITQVNATSMKDMGKVMGASSKKLAGIADGKRINEVVKQLLA